MIAPLGSWNCHGPGNPTTRLSDAPLATSPDSPRAKRGANVTAMPN